MSSKNELFRNELQREFPMKLSRYISRRGTCSRRKAEELIRKGLVILNKKIEYNPCAPVTDPDASVQIKGMSLPGEKIPSTRLFLYHKPRGLITTHSDTEGRPTVFEMLPKHLRNLMSVGRLDINSEGLLLLTNNGSLAQYLALPKNKFERVYRVRIHGVPSESHLKRMMKGILIDGMYYKCKSVVVDKQLQSNTWLKVVLDQGRNREIRKIMEFFNFTVNRLIRISFGPFHLGNIPSGSILELPALNFRSLLKKALPTTSFKESS